MKCVSCDYWIGQPNIPCPSCHAPQPPRTPPLPTSAAGGKPPLPAQPAAPSPERFCTHCGAKIFSGAQYCSGCGRAQDTSAANSSLNSVRNLTGRLGGISPTTIGVLIILIVLAFFLARAMQGVSENLRRDSGDESAQRSESPRLVVNQGEDSQGDGDQVDGNQGSVTVPSPAIPAAPPAFVQPPPVPSASSPASSPASAGKSAIEDQIEDQKDRALKAEMEYVDQAQRILERKSRIPQLEGANDVEAALSIVSRMQQDFDRLDVPPRFAHFHSLAQSALSQWSVGLVEMYRGIRTGQQVGVDRGKATVSRGNGLLAQAQNELHRIRDQGNPYR